MAVRRSGITAAYRDGSLADLDSLAIGLDPHPDQHAWTKTLQLADRHRLTLHDAAYLELAHRRQLPLATLDTELAAAAGVEQILVIA